MSRFTFEDIARYASGDMDSDELAAFEAELATDEDLQKKLALHQEVHSTLQQRFAPNEKLQAFQQTLRQLNGEYFAQARPATSPAPVKRIRLAAITTAAAAVVALLIWRPWQGGDLYTRYASVEMIANIERGNTTDSLLTEATTYFNNKDYSNAARLLKTITDSIPGNSFAQFYYALSLTQTNQQPLARPVLLSLYNGTSIFKYDAAFHMALTYVSEKNNTEAKTWLGKIPPEATIYAKAQALLKEL